MAIEIVHLPKKNIVILHLVMLARLPEGKRNVNPNGA